MLDESSKNIDKSQVGAEESPLRPEPELHPRGVLIDKMSPSQRAELLMAHLGSIALNTDSEMIYRYNGQIWKPLSDLSLGRTMAAIYTRHKAPFGDSAVSVTVSTMKLIVPELPVPSDELIGFANGVYDMATLQFRPHAAADGLLHHNGIVYEAPQPGETIEQHAPNFIKWLSHSVENDTAKMDRIKAALYMVLANRYDWQLFLEVTGEGGSGKSIFAQVAILLAGGPRNVGAGNMQALDNARGRFQYVGKRLITLPDQLKYVGDGCGIKAITGGDMVEIDGKYEKQFAAVIRAVVLATNNDPMVITERNGGVARRRVIFTFNRLVSEADKDITLGDKIAAELPVVIRHLLARFADPELARNLLLEQRDGAEALAIKQEADPVIAMCAMLEFLDDVVGLRVGGGNSAHDPLNYLYHFYVEHLRAEGLERPLHRTAFGKAMHSGAKAYRAEYKTRRSNGDTVTNVKLRDEARSVLPQARLLDD